MWNRLVAETSKDPCLSSVRNSVVAGLPIEGELKSSAGELSEVKGILKGCKIIIPAHIRKEILEKIHQRHVGLNKSKLRARRSVFWSGINSDIENFFQTCATCKKYAYCQLREPVQMRPVPD